jgi:hypothetical protein
MPTHISVRWREGNVVRTASESRAMIGIYGSIKTHTVVRGHRCTHVEDFLFLEGTHCKRKQGCAQKMGSARGSRSRIACSLVGPRCRTRCSSLLVCVCVCVRPCVCVCVCVGVCLCVCVCYPRCRTHKSILMRENMHQSCGL